MIVSLSALLVSALAVSASPVEETRHKKELQEHYHHLSYIADFSCHHPQPRTVPVHELLSPYQTRGKAYFPEVTVLHRCDVFAGCCEGGKKCGPLHADNLHLPFKVTYLEDMGDKHKGDWVMEYFSLDNHTVCGCDHHHGLFEPSRHVDHVHDHDHHSHDDHDHHSHDSRDHHDHYNPSHDHDDHHIPSHKLGPKPVYEEQHDEPGRRLEKKPDQKYDNKKIDSLYITL